MEGSPAEPPPAAGGAAVFGAAARPLWLLNPDITYLNHGSFGATPRAVLEAQAEWRRRMEFEPVRFMTQIRDGLLREAAATLAAFLGASGDDLVFVDNATTGINTILQSLVLEAGDEVVTTSHVYPAVRLTLEEVCGRRRARLVEAAVPFPARDEDCVLEAIDAAMAPHTRLAVIDHVTSPTALVLPIKRIAKLCAARGVRLLVDGAHAPGMLTLDLPEIGAEWYVGNCHKWLCAPKGCGFLWARREAQASLKPLVISHGYRSGFTAAFDWTGTRDPTPFLAIEAAIDFRRRFGETALRTYVANLAATAAEQLSAAWQSDIGSGPALRGAMVTVKLPDTGSQVTLAAAERLHDRLFDEWRIEVPVLPFAGSLWVRISAFAYNELGDYARLAAAFAPGIGRAA
ncbi:MAG: aminotransferase class V-fold PLP-dependent enzyme [Rhodospirillaceae bacterium]|nr:aminotransferase class V-fold PLP-dependent enzyme [Rhodospirillaceae bacterium]